VADRGDINNLILYLACTFTYETGHIQTNKVFQSNASLL